MRKTSKALKEKSPQQSEEEKAAIIAFVVADCDVQCRWDVLAENTIREEKELPRQNGVIVAHNKRIFYYQDVGGRLQTKFHHHNQKKRV